MIQVCTGLHGNITFCKLWIFLSHIIITVNTKKFGNIPWINNEIKKAMKKRNTLYRRLKRSNNSATDRARYTVLRNKVVSLLRESKQRYFDKLNNADAKQFWRTMRLVKRKSSTIPFLQDDEDCVAIESNIDKANALNSFFHRCFNYDFPPLTNLPDALEPNLPADYCQQKSRCMIC